MIDIKAFISLLEKEFEEVSPGTLTESTNFRELDEWSSMHALIIIALMDTEFEVMLNGEDLSKMQTVQDLYSLVNRRIA
jgi:acyl carrier protein